MALTRLKDEYLEQDGVRFVMEDETGNTVACRVSHEALELSPDQWGRFGVAIEIAAALLEYGFSVLNLDTMQQPRGTDRSLVRRRHCGLSRRPRMDESARLEGGRLGDIS